MDSARELLLVLGFLLPTLMMVAKVGITFAAWALLAELAKLVRAYRRRYL